LEHAKNNSAVPIWFGCRSLEHSLNNLLRPAFESLLTTRKGSLLEDAGIRAQHNDWIRRPLPGVVSQAEDVR